MMWVMAYSPVALQNLAVLVRARRTALGLSVLEAARRAPKINGKAMSNTTWTNVEEGLSARDTSYVRIDTVLGWAPGSCTAILNGSTAAPLASEVVDGARLSETPGAEAVRIAVQSAVIATVPELTGTQIKALSDQVVADLQKIGLSGQ